ncbi:MAG: T9SS type A sorting domain-containing protein [Flavobacteriaceae bacterium]|nr:T9SS type A sorting domain-containing protein [Flavobacteriaceae bacterium]
MVIDELRIGLTWTDVTPTAAVASVGERTINGFSTYPNPVNNGYLTVKTSSASEKEVLIYNVLGKQVFTQKFSGTSKLLDISNIGTGIYIMKVIEGDKIATKKLVIR